MSYPGSRPLWHVKLLAFGVHAGLSLSIFLTFFLLASLVWYPEFYYAANGVWLPMLTIAFVDVGLGPLMTLVLYKPGKPGLKFDLSMVAMFQVCALLWGTWVLYSQRPALTVFDQGVFYCLSDTAARAAQSDPAAFALRDPGERVPLAYLPPPANPTQEAWRDSVLRRLSGDTPAVGAYVFGQEFQPVDAASLPAILRDELDISTVTQLPHNLPHWQAFQARHGEASQQFAYYTLSCGLAEELVAMDRASGRLVDAMPIAALNARLKRNQRLAD